MPKLLSGFVVLALSIAIPATFSAPWFIYALWLAIAVAVIILIVSSAPIKQAIPWRLMRKDEDAERVIARSLKRMVLRRDLQVALTSLNDTLQNPKPAELRAFADNLAKRLKDDGYDVTAKKAEVHLPDNADADAITKRRSELHTQVMRLLIWDEFE